MQTSPTRAAKPTHPAVAAGFLLLITGLTAWAWTGTWQYAATGAGLLLIAAVAANVRPIDPRR